MAAICEGNNDQSENLIQIVNRVQLNIADQQLQEILENFSNEYQKAIEPCNGAIDAETYLEIKNKELSNLEEQHSELYSKYILLDKAIERENTELNGMEHNLEILNKNRYNLVEEFLEECTKNPFDLYAIERMLNLEALVLQRDMLRRNLLSKKRELEECLSVEAKVKKSYEEAKEKLAERKVKKEHYGSKIAEETTYKEPIRPTIIKFKYVSPCSKFNLIWIFTLGLYILIRYLFI